VLDVPGVLRQGKLIDAGNAVEVTIAALSEYGMNEKRERWTNSLYRLVIACRLPALRHRAVHRRTEASHRTPNG